MFFTGDFDAAKRLLTISTDTGFRNSGFTFGKAGKVVLAIRSTHGLEVPLTDESGNYFKKIILMQLRSLKTRKQNVKKIN